MQKNEKRDTVLGTDNFLLKKADILWKEEKHNCIAPIKENQEERYDEALQRQLWTIWDLDLQGIVAMKRCENAAGPVEQKMGFTAFQFLQTDVFFFATKKVSFWQMFTIIYLILQSKAKHKFCLQFHLP